MEEGWGQNYERVPAIPAKEFGLYLVSKGPRKD